MCAEELEQHRSALVLWLSIVAGACFVTFFLSPLGGLVDAAANIVLAMLFLKPDEEDPQPEFV